MNDKQFTFTKAVTKLENMSDDNRMLYYAEHVDTSKIPNICTCRFYLGQKTIKSVLRKMNGNIFQLSTDDLNAMWYIKKKPIKISIIDHYKQIARDEYIHQCNMRIDELNELYDWSSSPNLPSDSHNACTYWLDGYNKYIKNIT